ncbi:MAG: RNA ligase family protein [Chloroflexota bacterium]
MNGMFRFPRTPHLAWLSSGEPRDDKLLPPPEAQALLKDSVIVEEKIDGANLGISVDSDGEIHVRNRGNFLEPPYFGQFQRLQYWLCCHQAALFDCLHDGLTLYGEWLAARHSVAYDKLPDWFIAFDIYDQKAERFWSTRRRDELVQRASLCRVPTLFRGKTSIDDLKRLIDVEPSRFRDGPLEGVVVRSETEAWLIARAKLVRADFVQNIGEHWSRRGMEWNQLAVVTGARRG